MSEEGGLGSCTQKEAVLGSTVKLCESVSLRAWVWQQGPPGPAAATSHMGSRPGWTKTLQLQGGGHALPCSSPYPQSQAQLGSRQWLGLRLLVA